MDINKPIIIIDASSMVFYRYFALKRWLALSDKEKEFNKDQILDKFACLFEKNLVSIQKNRQLKVSWENIIVARDCNRDNIWRKTLYKEYKGNRKNKSNIDFDPATFTIVFNELLPKMQQKYGKFHVIQCDHAEADDIIAITCRYVRNELNVEDTPIYIFSLDTDFLQLESKHTHVYNFSIKKLNSNIKDERLSNYLLWKIIRGDASDNIPSIDSKIGDVTALQIAKRIGSIENFYKVDNKALLDPRFKNTRVVEAFIRNNTLINFDYIPSSIYTEVTEHLKNEIKKRK